MPRAHDPFGVNPDRQPGKGMGGPIPDFGQYTDFTDTWGLFIDGLLKQIKDWTGIDLYWLLDWSWTTNSFLELVRQANDLFAWLQNPIQRPPNLLSRPSFSSPSAIAAAPDWSWDPVVSLGTVEGPYGVLRTDPQGSAQTIADGSVHSMLSNAISEPVALTPGQILVCQVHALVESGFTASDDQAIRLELVPSRFGVLQDAVVIAHCGVPVGDPGDWVAAPVGSKAVFFDVDYTVPVEDSPDTVELRLVVGESAGGDVPVRFDGARVAAAGGFLVVLSDLFDAGRIYLTELWEAITAWLEDVFDPANWAALKTDTDDAFDAFVRRVKRALHHADADIFHPPSTSSILSNALKSNPWFGWLFDMVDSWLQPVLLAGKAGTAFWETVWHALTAFAAAPTAGGAWSTLTAAIQGAWESLVDDILEAWGSVKTHADFVSPGTATMAALRNNDWFGWLFDLIDTWLQPVLNIGKALTDFGDDLWHAVTTYAANPLASGAWPALVNALNDAWNVAVDAVLSAWGSPKTHADFASPAEAAEKVIKNNPVTGWLFGNTFEGGGWLDDAIHAITDPIGNFFDQVRKYINQMVEPLHWGYFDENWLWVAALSTPDTELPGDAPVMTPGSNDGDGGGIAPGADTSIPAAPKNVSAIPFWDITVSGFPAGNITYAIAAVKSGVEGPATQVKTFVGTLFPPNSSTHVDLRWDAVSGASSYRVYRKADGYSTTTAWRLVATPSSNGTLLAPVVDKTARASGTVAAPKTDAELAAQIVSSVKSTASTASSNASAAQSAVQATNAAITAATGSSGNTSTAVQAALENIPQANVMPTVVESSTAVTFDAVTTASRSTSYQDLNHTLGVGANYLVVTAEYIQNAAWSSTPDVRVNGVQASATPIVNVEYNSTNTSGRRVLVVHAIPLTGQTGTITVSMPRYASTTQHWITVQSFIGVSSTSPVQAGAATGSSLSHSITTRFRGGIVSQTFAIAGNGTLSGYSGGNAATPGGSEMVTGTVPADANITVTATASTSGDSYRSALIMYPTQTVDSGSGAVFTRNSGGSISVSPANSMLPSNYYTSRVHTPDLQITSSGGIEVSFDGWYLVRINLSSPVLYKNELPYRYGDGPYIIYCRAGDSLNAGYTSTFTATAGDQNVFEVALMNRSLL